MSPEDNEWSTEHASLEGMDEEVTPDSERVSEKSQESTPVENYHHALDRTKMPRRRRIIIRVVQDSNHFDSPDEDEHRPRRRPRNRRRRGEANGYPTKNFLPNFKGPHIQFLES